VIILYTIIVLMVLIVALVAPLLTLKPPKEDK